MVNRIIKKIREYILMFSIFSVMPCFCYVKSFFVKAKDSQYIKNEKISSSDVGFLKNDLNNNKPISEYIIKLKIKDKITEMPFWKYLVGVVCAECSPTIFHEQTVISNIIAAASYAIAKRGLNGIFEADNNVFQSFMPYEECKKKFPDKTIARLEELCKYFSNYVLVYKQGENYKPVEALYHTISSGITQNSEDVWGNKVSYLVSRKSPIKQFFDICNKKDIKKMEEELEGLKTGEEKAKLAAFVQQFKINYEQKRKINFYDAFKKIKEYIKKKKPNCNLIEPTYIKNIDKKYIEKYIKINKRIDKTNHVKEVWAFGENLTGQNCAEIFKLKSTCFEIDLAKDKNNELEFTVKGAGHCLGMDQYGANIFALKGSSYLRILKHFYGKNCKIIKTDEVKPEFIFKKIN